MFELGSDSWVQLTLNYEKVQIMSFVRWHRIYGAHLGKPSFHQKQPSAGVLRKRCSKICSKFTREHPCRSVVSIMLLCNFIEITLRHGCSLVKKRCSENMEQIYRRTCMSKYDFNNHISAWLFSCKFAPYFQNTFS